MAATKEEIKELAEHIYDLDAEVYVHLGSSLGRVFNRDRECCVNELTELLTTRPQGHLVRSELGLIANMARTIEDKEERAMCMTEYNRILNEVMSLPTSFASGDVIDPILAKLNSFNVANRFFQRRPSDYLPQLDIRKRPESMSASSLRISFIINYYDCRYFRRQY